MQGTLLILDPIAATLNLFLIQDPQDRKSNDFRFNEHHNTKTTTHKENTDKFHQNLKEKSSLKYFVMLKRQATEWEKILSKHISPECLISRIYQYKALLLLLLSC